MKTPIKFFSLAFCFAFIFISVSCRKKCRKECSDSSLTTYARGFAESELDSVIIEEFADNGKFDQLRSKKVDNFQGESQENFGTLIGWFDKHSDWVISFPRANRAFKVSAITDEGKPFIEEDCRIKDSFCQNEIATFKIDGVERIRVPAYLDK